MGKLVAPKHSAKWDEVRAAFEIYYQADDWLDNDTYEILLKSRIGSNQYPSSYPKKIQLLTYYGFIEYKEPKNKRSEKRITDLGKIFYEDLISGDKHEIWESIVSSLETTTFGRNNDGAPLSDSDIELPAVCIKAMLSLDGASLKEMTYVLYLLNEKGASFEDAIKEVKNARRQVKDVGDFTPPEYKKFNDNKPLKILRDWGDFLILSSDGKYNVNPAVVSEFQTRLEMLPTHNTFGTQETAKNDIDILDEDKYASAVRAFDPSALDTAIDISELNNRAPEPSGGDVKNTRYTTKAIIGAIVLKKHHYKCEYASLCGLDHETFLTKKKSPYMECHHLIPMKAQKDFEANLDREENIVPLCPVCHAAIHYGSQEVREKIVKALFENRKDSLENCEGHISISLEDLFRKYYQ